MKHLTFILLLVMTCSLAKARQDDRGYIVKVGEKAPNIELLFPDGTKKQLKDLTGKVIMIGELYHDDTIHRQLVRCMP